MGAFPSLKFPWRCRVERDHRLHRLCVLCVSCFRICMYLLLCLRIIVLPGKFSFSNIPNMPFLQKYFWNIYRPCPSLLCYSFGGCKETRKMFYKMVVGNTIGRGMVDKSFKSVFWRKGTFGIFEKREENFLGKTTRRKQDTHSTLSMRYVCMYSLVLHLWWRNKPTWEHSWWPRGYTYVSSLSNSTN